MSILEQIKEKAKRFFKDASGSHDWGHTERVYALCLRIGKKEKADLKVLKLAALLHDIGREEEIKSEGKICHAKRSAALARRLLKKYKFNKKKIDKITHCIETHRFRGKDRPKSKEARILFDADNLDAIGAVGIGRAFLFAGEIGAKLHNKGIDVLKTKGYSREDTAYREFMVKLRKIKDRMLTGEGKRLARQRHKFMVEFFRRLDKEVEGVL